MAVKSDGQVVIDTRINTNGFNTGVNGMKKQMNTLNGSLLKFGKTLSVVFAVKKLIDFGKEAIDLGSDLQEVQNVVDVTFTTMNDAVDKFARNAAKSAGLSETMAKKYTGTFGAMAKAFDFAEKESFDMATSLTQLTGDVASFYNLTQDEAYTKLKSVFTGETESLKDLGVVMTQSALDAFAMAEGYGKTTKQMTEQEKVALRYAFVLDQLSGASGDFVRTSDGWANQMRILNLNFDSFKANIGQALINIFTPFLRILNVIVDKMAQLSQRFVAFSEALVGKSTSGGGGSPGEALAEISGGYEEITDATKEAAAAQKKYLSGLDEISRYDSDNISGGSSLQINTGITGNGTGIFDNSFNTAQDIEMPKIFTVFQHGLELITNILEKLKPYGDWFWDEFIKPFGNAFDEQFDSFLDTADGFLEFVNGVLTGDWERAMKGLIKWATSMTEGVDIAFNNLETLTLNPIVNFLKRSFEPEMEGTFSRMAGNIIMTLAGFATNADWKWDAAMKSISSGTDWMKRDVQGKLQLLDVFVSNIFTRMINSSNEKWRKLAKGIYDWAYWTYSSAKSPFKSLYSAIDHIFNIMGVSIKNRINTIIYIINRMVNGMVNGINSTIGALNQLSFSVPSWIPGIGGESFGFNIGYISAPQIPYLASGAVIPPNAPFMAVLGDQKHGTNIEAPLDTIKQAVREVVGGNGGNYRFTAQINRRTLFDEFIEEAKMRQSMTGKSPFELA